MKCSNNGFSYWDSFAPIPPAPGHHKLFKLQLCTFCSIVGKRAKLAIAEGSIERLGNLKEVIGLAEPMLKPNEKVFTVEGVSSDDLSMKDAITDVGFRRLFSIDNC